MAAPKRKGTANKVPRGNHRLWGFRFGVPCNGLLNLSLGVFSMGLGGIEFSLVIDFSLNLPWVGSAGLYLLPCVLDPPGTRGIPLPSLRKLS